MLYIIKYIAIIILQSNNMWIFEQSIFQEWVLEETRPKKGFFKTVENNTKKRVLRAVFALLEERCVFLSDVPLRTHLLGIAKCHEWTPRWFAKASLAPGAINPELD